MHALLRGGPISRGCGVCCAAGLAKVLLAFEHGYVPPNLHFTSPTPKSKALAEGRLKVGATASALNNVLS